MIKKYEIMTIINTSKGEAHVSSIYDSIKKIMTDLGAEIVKEDNWGKRKYAYEIKHQTEGSYAVIDFNFDTSKMLAFRAKLNFITDLVRYLIIEKE